MSLFVYQNPRREFIATTVGDPFASKKNETDAIATLMVEAQNIKSEIEKKVNDINHLISVKEDEIAEIKAKYNESN